MQTRNGLDGKQLAGCLGAGFLAAVAFALLIGLPFVKLLSTAWWVLSAGGALALMASGMLALLTIRSVTGVVVHRSRLLAERRVQGIADTIARVLALNTTMQASLTELKASMEHSVNLSQQNAAVGDVLVRLEAAERRTMAALETSVLDHHDSFAAIRGNLADLQRTMDPKLAQKSIRSHVSSTATDTVRQVEALMQLIPRVDTSTRRYPASSGYAMSPEGLLLLSDLLEEYKPRVIVEIGSGTSTVWGGTVAQRIGSRYLAIEHDLECLEKTMALASAFGLHGTVDCRLAELRDVSTPLGTMRWYDPSVFVDLAQIDLLIVDGPPGWTGDKARYPALPVLAEKLADNCLIFVDDMHREDEREIVRLWLEAFPNFQTLDSGVSRVGLLKRE